MIKQGFVPVRYIDILKDPNDYVKPGMKRPLRVKSKAKVMTDVEVIQDIEGQITEIENKQDTKRKPNAVKPKSTQPPPKKRARVTEDNDCYICASL